MCHSMEDSANTLQQPQPPPPTKLFVKCQLSCWWHDSSLQLLVFLRDVKLLWWISPVCSAIGVHPEFYSCASLFFLCRILCYGLAKKRLSEQGIIPLEAEHSARQAKYSGCRQWEQETYFLLSEISKPKRNSINYSPSLHQSDIWIMTGGAYVSVRLQSRHDRGSNSNMFVAEKYGPLWCESHLQGIWMNGRESGLDNSSGENAAYFMSHSPERNDNEITSPIILWITLMVIWFSHLK